MSTDPDNQEPSRAELNFGTSNTFPHATIQTGDVVGRDKITTTITNTYTAYDQYDVRLLRDQNPYLGLRSFTYEHRHAYAGREWSIHAAMAAITAPGAERTLYFITGASGSGKSSFVQAGLLPHLEQHYASHGITLRPATFRPTTLPLAALTGALRMLGTPIPAGQVLNAAHFINTLRSLSTPMQLPVLIIDQFEEVFSQSTAEDRNALLELLAHLPPFAEIPLHVLVTMRSDFLPDLFTYEQLYDEAKHGTDLRSMTERDIQTAIVRPLTTLLIRLAQEQPNLAQQVGAKQWDPTLLAALAADATQEAAYLPLLQVTLEDIFRRGFLVPGVYQTLTDAIRVRAEHVYHYIDYDTDMRVPRPADDRNAIIAIMLDLIQVGLDEEPYRDIRRSAPEAELLASHPECTALIHDLIQSRLLSIYRVDQEDASTNMIDIIHESLLTNWDRLAQAIVSERVVLQHRTRFLQSLAEWFGNPTSDDYLLTAIRLAEADMLQQRGDICVQSPQAQELIYQSRIHLDRMTAQRQAEQARQLEQAQALAETQRQRVVEQSRAAERLRRRTRYLIAAFSLSILAVVVAVWFWRDANRTSRLIQARYLVAQGQGMSQSNPRVGLRLMLEGLMRVENSDPLEQTALLTETLRVMGQGRVTMIITDTESVYPSDDNRYFVVNRTYHNAEVRSTSNGSLLATLSGKVTEVTFSPDYAFFIVSYKDTATELRRGYDGAKMAVFRQFSTSSFSPDGQILALIYESSPGELWKVKDGAKYRTLPGEASTISFSPNSQFVVVTYRESEVSTELRMADDGRVLNTFHVPDDFTGVKFSPDSQFFVAQVSTKGASELRRATDGKVIVVFEHAVDYAYSVVQFSPDSTTFIVDYHDTPTELRATSDGHIIQTLSGNMADVTYSPNGKLFVIGYEDTDAELRRSSNGEVVRRLNGRIFGALYSTGFPTVLIGYVGENRTGELINTDTGVSIVTYANMDHFIISGAIDFLIVDFRDDKGEMRSVRNGSLIKVLSDEIDSIYASDDSEQIIVDYDVMPGEVIDTRTGTTTRLPYAIATEFFVPQTKILVIFYENQLVQVWDWSSTPYKVADLGLGVADHPTRGRANVIFDDEKRRLLVPYTTGEFYILDAELLRFVNSARVPLLPEELSAFACKNIFSGQQWTAQDQALFNTIMADRTPLVCR